MAKVTIRPMQAEDAEAVAELSAMFGYPAPAGAVRTRIETLARSQDSVALVATLDKAVLGWIEASIERHLQSEAFVTIGGLVVSEKARGQGIGRQLCRAVEDWTLQSGIATMRVRSQQKRADAHRFYMSQGYAQVKVSSVFEKRLLSQG